MILRLYVVCDRCFVMELINIKCLNESSRGCSSFSSHSLSFSYAFGFRFSKTCKTIDNKYLHNNKISHAAFVLIQETRPTKNTHQNLITCCLLLKKMKRSEKNLSRLPICYVVCLTTHSLHKVWHEFFVRNAEFRRNPMNRAYSVECN